MSLWKWPAKCRGCIHRSIGSRRKEVTGLLREQDKYSRCLDLPADESVPGRPMPWLMRGLEGRCLRERTGPSGPMSPAKRPAVSASHAAAPEPRTRKLPWAPFPLQPTSGEARPPAVRPPKFKFRSTLAIHPHSPQLHHPPTPQTTVWSHPGPPLMKQTLLGGALQAQGNSS